MAVPEHVREWMLEQLHLATDNLHIQNSGQAVLSLSLYTWDGAAAWVQQSLGELKPTEHQWFTLTPLSVVFPGQTRPAGESVLVLRAHNMQKGQSASWRVDNVHNLWLQMALHEPSKSFSRSTGSKVLWTGALKPRSYGWGLLTTFSLAPIDGHWEYWFDDEIMRPPLP